MSKTLKINEVSSALSVNGNFEAVNGSKYREVKLGNDTVGFIFSNRLGVDEAGKPIWSEYEGELKIFLRAELKPGKVTVLGKKYDLVEKELTKDDGSPYKISVLQNAKGEEVGRYSKAYSKIGGRYKFYTNRWMVRFQVGE